MALPLKPRVTFRCSRRVSFRCSLTQGAWRREKGVPPARVATGGVAVFQKPPLRPHEHENNEIRSRERSTLVPFPPPLAPAKAFSRSGCDRIFPLFSRVMRVGLSTLPRVERPKRVLSARYSPKLMTAPFRCLGFKALKWKDFSERQLRVRRRFRSDCVASGIGIPSRA